jgi:hypothetical protein
MNFIPYKTTTSISDAVAALTVMVDTYNETEDYGPEISWIMLDHITKGIEALQAINPVYFTVEEIEWVNEITTQLNEIDSTSHEGEIQ